MMKAGGFPGLLVCQQRIQSQDNNHDRRIYKCLRTTYATSARLMHQVLVPGAHNLGMHSVCHSYHLLAPTRTMSRAAYSYVQRRSASPSSEESVIYQEYVVSVQTQPTAGNWQDMLEVSHSQKQNRTTALPTTTQKLQAAEVKDLKGGTERIWGSGSKTDTDSDSRKQAAERSSSQQVSHCTQMCFSTEVNAPHTALITQSTDPTHIKEGSISPLCLSCSQKLRLKSW